MLLAIVRSLGIRVFGGTFASVEPPGWSRLVRSRTPAGNSENCASSRLTEHAENVAATAREPESGRRDGPVAKCYSSCYSLLGVLGAFRVGWCRMMSRAVSRHIAASN